MNPLFASALVGIFFATVGSLLIRPDRPLAVRLRPYLLYGRSRSGMAVDVDRALSSRYAEGSLLSFLVGPVRAVATMALEAVIDTVEASDELTLRLRRAGFGDAAPETYRRWQVRVAGACSVAVSLISVGLGRLTGRSLVVWAAAGFLTGFWLGAIAFRSHLKGKAQERGERLKLEAYSIATLLAVSFRTGAGPISGLRQVAERANGEIASDLDRAFLWLARGNSSRETLERLARESPDPATTRIFRLLATATDSGLNPAVGMRQLADELRKVRREEIDQQATKRRSLMLVPTMFFMLPVIVLYALAPGPSVLFGL